MLPRSVAPRSAPPLALRREAPEGWRERGWAFLSEVGRGSAPGGETKLLCSLGAEDAACFDLILFRFDFVLLIFTFF